MKKISPYLYVEKSMSITNQEKIKSAIPKAKKYVVDIYGNITTQPIIYACETRGCAKSFGLIGTTIGLRLFGHLILVDKGLNKEVMSHEWSHEELYTRIGGFYNWYMEIPLWFDEGLASLTMHKYSHYDETAWNRIIDEKIPYPHKDELISLNQWNEANSKYLNNDEIVVPYATARHIVSTWYKEVGQKGLLKLLDGIKKGQEFRELYSVLTAQSIK